MGRYGDKFAPRGREDANRKTPVRYKLPTAALSYNPAMANRQSNTKTMIRK